MRNMLGGNYVCDDCAEKLEKPGWEVYGNL